MTHAKHATCTHYCSHACVTHSRAWSEMAVCIHISMWQKGGSRRSILTWLDDALLSKEVWGFKLNLSRSQWAVKVKIPSFHQTWHHLCGGDLAYSTYTDNNNTTRSWSNPIACTSRHALRHVASNETSLLDVCAAHVMTTGKQCQEDIVSRTGSWRWDQSVRTSRRKKLETSLIHDQCRSDMTRDVGMDMTWHDMTGHDMMWYDAYVTWYEKRHVIIHTDVIQ